MTSLIKERPILFSGAMVRALLAGTKTQTRRIVKGDIRTEAYEAADEWDQHRDGKLEPMVYDADGGSYSLFDNLHHCPYGEPGDQLIVGEAWRTLKKWDHLKPSELPKEARDYIAYEADGTTLNGEWGRYRNARFLPARFRRILLEIVSVRVERLQDISEADAVAEGSERGIYRPYGTNSCQLEMNQYGNYKDGYRYIWESINGPGSWDANPWVWVVEFKRIDAEGKEVAHAA